MAVKKNVVVGSKSALGAGKTVVAPVPSSGASSPTQGKPVKGFRLQLQQMLAGLQSVLPSDGTLQAPGGGNTSTISVSTAVGEIQAGLAQYSTVDAAVLAVTAARQQMQAGLPGLKTQYGALKQALIFFFGASSPQLTQFGFKPKKAPAKQSPETKVAAVEKRLQTRAIRNTEGPKQKAQKKFTGTIQVATQINAVPSGTPKPSGS